MKTIKPVNVQKIFYFPLLLTILFATIVSLISYSITITRFKSEILDSGVLLSKTLASKITDNLKYKQAIIDDLDRTLLTIGEIVLEYRDELSNDYLKTLVDLSDITDIYWYDSNGIVIYDANNEYVGWTAKPGDPISTFMESGLEVYVEDIRKSTDDDRYYKFAYLRAADGYFVQVGCDAAIIYDATETYDYQNVLNSFIEENDSLLYGLVVSPELIAIADTDIDEIGMDYSGDEDYLKVLAGETLMSDWYYPKIEEMVFEISTPLIYDDVTIGLLGIGFAYTDYIVTKTILIIVFLGLTMGFIFIYTMFQFSKVIRPLNQLNSAIQSIDIEKIEYRNFTSNDGVFAGMHETILNLCNRIFDSNKRNQRLIAAVSHLAYFDQLTTLPNRTSAKQKLIKETVEGNQFALLFIDLDDFKSFNDTKGHHFGDSILVSISNRLNILSNDNIFISRYAGDEFLILAKYDSIAEIHSLLKSIEHLFELPIQIEGNDYFLEASIGISLYPENGENTDELIRKADIAMYSAKKTDYLSYQFFKPELDVQVESKSKIVKALKSAIKDDEFMMVYQPQVNIDTHEIVSLEALLRLKFENISPAIFIPIAEQNKLINRIGRIVLEKVVRQQVLWRNQGYQLVPVYVNFSSFQLDDINIIEFIRDLLQENDLDPSLLGVEITESVMIQRTDTVIKVLQALKRLGLRTAIDDFGSGHAGINYLTNFEVDLVKLDKSFSDKFLVPEKMEIYKTILRLSDLLGFTTLAEGIETKAQIDLLEDTSCRFVQGFYYHRPTNPETIAAQILIPSVPIV